MKNTPSAQLMDDLRVYSYPQFSHNRRYIAYEYGIFLNKIGLWDTVTNEHMELLNTSENLPYDATLGGITFTPNDDRILFAFKWNGEDNRFYTKLATTDIKSKEITQLEIENLQATFYNIESSLDGKWVVSDMVTQNNQVCFLTDLEEQEVKCLIYQEGWYSSVKFTPDSNYIVYDHSKSITDTTSIVRSKIDGTENKVLVSGFLGAAPLIITQNEIIFAADTLFNSKRCSHMYAINLNGSNFRKLSYLGEKCSSGEK